MSRHSHHDRRTIDNHSGEGPVQRRSPLRFWVRAGAVAGLMLLAACTPPSVAHQPPVLVTLTPGDAAEQPAEAPPATDAATPAASASETAPPPTDAPPTTVPATNAPPTDIPPTTPPPATDAPTVPPATEPSRANWPPALAAPGRSKMGIHVLLVDDPRIVEFVGVAKPRVIKVLDEFDWLVEARALSPETIVLGRHTAVPNRAVLDNKPPDQYPNPEQFAAEFINQYLNDYARYRNEVDYWEGWNEFLPQNPDEWAWFAAFEAARACQMQSLGFRAAVGSFSTGTPEWADMARFMPALEAADRCGAIFTLHEYGAPLMTDGAFTSIPGAPASLNAIAGALTLRYRYWYEGYIKPRGLNVPLVISEAGVDGGVAPGCPADPRQGWLGCVNDWQQAGLTDPPWQVYIDQLNWYDAQTQQDDYVLGFTVFTAGSNDNPAWISFSINDLLVPMAVAMVAQP